MGAKILLIEDNPGDVELVKISLENDQDNYEFYHVSSFKQAEQALISKSWLYDVILLDLGLPDLSGIELIKRILGLTTKIPVIVLTGLKDFDLSVTSLGLGVSDYLFKDELSSINLSKSITHNIERKKILNNLKRTESKYKKLFEQNNSPIFVWNQGLYKIIDCNRAAIETYGYTLSEFYQMSIRNIHPLSEIAKNKDRLEKPGGAIMKHRAKNGKLLYMSLSSYLTNIDGINSSLIILNDETEHYEAALREEEPDYMFEMLFNRSSTPKIIIKPGSFELISLNEKARHLFQTDSVDIHPANILNYLSDKGRVYIGLLDQLIQEDHQSSVFGLFNLVHLKQPKEFVLTFNNFKFKGQNCLLVELSEYQDKNFPIRTEASYKRRLERE